jgi:hypothetical protein
MARRQAMIGVVEGALVSLGLTRPTPVHAERRANPREGELPANPPGTNGSAPPSIPPGSTKRSEKSQGRNQNDTGPFPDF